MKPIEAIDRLYYNITLNELRLMNENTIYPNITYNSLLYLDLISYKENCTVSYLADALHISKAAVTKKVNELIKQGLVVKTQSEKDRRIFYLSIGPAIDEDFNRYDKQFVGAVQFMEKDYSQAELDKFCQMLNQISDYYTKEPY